MNLLIFIVFIVMLLIILFQDWNRIKLIQMHVDAYTRLREAQEKERYEWKQERQQLLDRIQAGSFAEYKTQEVRVIKAQSGVQEPPKLEQL